MTVHLVQEGLPISFGEVLYGQRHSQVDTREGRYGNPDTRGKVLNVNVLLMGDIELFARLVISPVARPKVDRTSPRPEMSCCVGFRKSATSSA
jgi:hypothetical protein